MKQYEPFVLNYTPHNVVGTYRMLGLENCIGSQLLYTRGAKQDFGTEMKN